MNALIERLLREAKTEEDFQRLRAEVTRQRREFEIGWPMD